jgi:hypothetical protein
MSGYANRVIKLTFDLSEDPASDPIWVVIRNPKLLPPQMFRNSGAAELEVDDAGKPKDANAAADTGAAMAGKLVIAWRVYDATTSPEYDPNTGDEVPGTGQELLPAPSGGNGVAPELYAKLPSEIQIKIMQTIAEAINPPSGQDATTPKTSSGPQSPSSTAPGDLELAQQN